MWRDVAWRGVAWRGVAWHGMNVYRKTKQNAQQTRYARTATHAHTGTHARMHARTHVQMHAHSHTCSYACMHLCAHIHPYVCMHTHTFPCARTHAQTQTRMHASSPAPLPTHTHERMPPCARMRASMRTRALFHAYMCTLPCARFHAHACTNPCAWAHSGAEGAGIEDNAPALHIGWLRQSDHATCLYKWLSLTMPHVYTNGFAWLARPACIWRSEARMAGMAFQGLHGFPRPTACMIALGKVWLDHGSGWGLMAVGRSWASSWQRTEWCL